MPYIWSPKSGKTRPAFVLKWNDNRTHALITADRSTRKRWVHRNQLTPRP